MISIILSSLLISQSPVPSPLILGVREVRASSCDVIRLNVALGITSQIVFEQSPTLTLHADEQHFKIRSNPDAKRSIAIIPFVESTVVNQMFSNNQSAVASVPSQSALAKKLDEAFATNLFVFFKNSNQLMFQLRFVEKSKADYVLSVKQVYRKDCQL